MPEIQWIGPRQTPERDDRYMALAIAWAGLSKDPSTQMGAFIVTSNNIPRGGGYNGPSAVVDDNAMNWNRDAGKNDLIDHAEENAMEYANGPLEGCTIYVTGFPCKGCMKQIVRKRFARVVYLERPYDPGSMQANQADFKRSMEIAASGGVKVEVYKGTVAWLPDWLGHLKQQGILPI